MLLQKREPLPVDTADLLHVNRLPYHSIYLVKRDPPPAVIPTPVPIEKPDYFTRRQLLARERRSRRAQSVRENRVARNI